MFPSLAVELCSLSIAHKQFPSPLACKQRYLTSASPTVSKPSAMPRLAPVLTVCCTIHSESVLLEDLQTPAVVRKDKPLWTSQLSLSSGEVFHKLFSVLWKCYNYRMVVMEAGA